MDVNSSCVNIMFIMQGSQHPWDYKQVGPEMTEQPFEIAWTKRQYTFSREEIGPFQYYAGISVENQSILSYDME